MAVVANSPTVQQNSAVIQAVSHDQIFNKIQEALPDCIAADDVEPLLEIFDGKVSEAIKVYVETAVRAYVMQCLCKGDETDISRITSVVKLSTALSRKGVCLPTLPMLVLSDAFDSLTVQQCEKLFSFVESNVSTWKEPMFFALSKNQVLRMCNDVLRRLSRSQNTIFCGRILLFLARFFPFSERSGLNLISEFNLENVTTFSSSEADEAMDVSEGKEEGGDDEVKEIKEDKETKEEKPTLDHTLYTKFWALQDFFRNPIQCYQKGPWKLFTSYTTDVLEAFSSFKLDYESQSDDAAKVPLSYNALVEQREEGENADATIVDSLPNVKKIDQYFAKFLTNQRLLDLQFSDSNFRRYVLVQLLVLCHYLTAVIKFKQESLGHADIVWVRGIEQKVYTLLTETPPDGLKFVEIIKKILQREDQWNDWKNNGCPEIKKTKKPATPVVVDGATPNGKLEVEVEEEKPVTAKRGRKRKIGDLVRDADSKNKFSMANAEMTRLWNLCPDNVEAMRQSKRAFIPSLEDYFTRSIEQIHSPDDVPVADRLVQDSNFGWRGLRILACRSPHFFTHSTAPIATLPEYLTNMIKKLAKDMPAVNGRVAATPQQTDGKQEEEEEKIIADPADVAENCEVMEEEDEAPAREELLCITKDEQAALAANLASGAAGKWKTLTKKLGFKDDEVDYILTQKSGSVLECAKHFLQLWVENEGEDGNKESIVYILEGLKMPEVAKGVFN